MVCASPCRARRINVDGGAATDLPEHRKVGADDGAAVRHGLEYREAEAFEEGGEDDEARLAVETFEFVVGHPAEELHVRREPEPFDDRHERVVAVAAGDDELRSFPVREQRDGFEQHPEVLVRHAVADAQQQVRAALRRLTVRRLGRPRRGG